MYLFPEGFIHGIKLMILKYSGDGKYMINDLIENINKIHSTELGIIRVKKNLELKTNDIIKYTKKLLKRQTI